ncbi:unnamed protein product [Sphacelaria rigidula]
MRYLSQLDLGAEIVHGDNTSLYELIESKQWEMEEIITLAQGDGGPDSAESNDGFGLFYVASEDRMLAMDSKDPGYIHLNNYFESLGSLSPSVKRENRLASMSETSKSNSSTSELSATGAPASPASRSSSSDECASDSLALGRKGSRSFLDGLLEAGVKEPMLGIARAGYANTVGAALEDTGLGGVCYCESEWDVDGDRTFIVKGGLGLVVDELASGIRSCIQTSWPAAKVDYGTPGRVLVTCEDGRTEQGTHLVSTLPLSVMQDGDVEFSPPLPETNMRALNKMGMCSVSKVILKFDQQVLPPLLHGCISSDSFIPEFWFSPLVATPENCSSRSCSASTRCGNTRPLCRHLPNTPEGGYTVLAVGFAAGPPADAISALPQEEALQKALQQLDTMFGGRDWLVDCGGCTGKGDWENHKSSAQTTSRQADDDNSTSNCELKWKHSGRNDQDVVGAARKQTVVPGMLPSDCYGGGLVHSWADERFVRGGYCYPRLDFDENTFADAASSVENRLFFAGEHTNIPMGGSLHAAMDSGDR